MVIFIARIRLKIMFSYDQTKTLFDMFVHITPPERGTTMTFVIMLKHLILSQKVIHHFNIIALFCIEKDHR